MFYKDFIDKGFVVIKSAFSKDLIKKIQNLIISEINPELKNKNFSYKENYNIFSLNVKKASNTYEYVKKFYEILIFHKIYSELLQSKKIFQVLSSILGKDLCHIEDPSLVLNLPQKSNPKDNYLYKNWHQEIWSGTSTSTLILWTPIFQSEEKSGQIEIIESSHQWGHIPHNNRTPTMLPKNYKSIKTNLSYTDIIIFHSLSLHRSLPLISKDGKFNPRLAMPTSVRNFKYNNHSFDMNKNWKIFSISELTAIEQKLGNHYLSPFRLQNLEK
jgi:ectoine hydroxylase-related dioxygenase (phytanoyl-CoA dioxygenase family)